jgi:competence protein ComEC
MKGIQEKYIWNQIPLFRVLWPYILGVLIGIFYPFVVSAIASGLALSLIIIFILVFEKARKNWVVLLPVIVVLAGYCIAVLNTEGLNPNHYTQQDLDQTDWIVGTLQTDPIERSRSVKAELRLEHASHMRDTTALLGDVLIYFEKDERLKTLRYGDRLVLNGNLNEISGPKNPGEFDYRRYLKMHQIESQIYVSSGHWRLMEEGGGLRRWISDVQQKFISVLKSNTRSNRELAILSALLIGNKQFLSADQVSAFAGSGAMHVLAVSGLHVGIIFLLVSFLLKPIERIRWGGYLKGLLLLITLWLYAGITGLSPSVTRAATMFSFIIVANQFGRHTDIYNTLATSALFLLLVNPFLILEVGFQLSYLAVLGIVILYPKIYALWKPKWWILDKVWSISAVSIAAQLATFPLALLYFHQFPNYFLLSNLIVIPAATVIIPLGIALLAFHWVPFLGDWISFLLNKVVHWLDRAMVGIEGLPFAVLNGIDIGAFETVIMYALVICIVTYLVRRRFIWLPMSVLLLCFLEGVNVHEYYQQIGQRSLTIYSIKGADAIDLRRGHTHLFISNFGDVDRENKLSYNVRPSWWQNGLEEPLESSLRPGLYGFEQRQLLVLDETRVDIDCVGAVDWLYISNRTAMHPLEILEKVNAKRVVLSVNLDWKTRRYWLRQLERNNIPHHDMRIAGAFIEEV